MRNMKNKQILKAILNWIWKILLALLLIAAGVYLWALKSTDTSLIARGIMWGDSDAGDLHRFPTRMMQASNEPVEFEPAVGDLENIISELPITNDDIGVVDMPFDEYLAYTNTTAFIVLHGDQLLYEAYYNGADRDSLQTSFSAAKSFTSTLVGIAIGEGFIESLDAPITDYLPELSARDPRFEEITIRHLITMTSGLRWERNESTPLSDDFISYYSPDLRAAALEVEIVTSPGIEFLYNDYNPALVGMILERATGMTVSDYMETRLWQPMGAEGDGSWSLDSKQSGFEKMFVGVNGRAIDLIKLGWLFLNDGKNGENQVVPASWVEEATRIDTITDPASFYQYYWWIDEEHQMYFAEGDKCQFIFVYPQAELVVARFGIDCGGTGFSAFIPNVALWVEAQLKD
jgi:CubicO group peptidase (beta-lactamase class C family)